MSSKHTFLNLERARCGRTPSEDNTYGYYSCTESVDSEALTVDSLPTMDFDCTDNSSREHNRSNERMLSVESFSSLESVNSKCSTVIANTASTCMNNHNHHNTQLFLSSRSTRQREQIFDNTSSLNERQSTPTPTKYLQYMEENSKIVAELLKSTNDMHEYRYTRK